MRPATLASFFLLSFFVFGCASGPRDTALNSCSQINGLAKSEEEDSENIGIAETTTKSTFLDQGISALAIGEHISAVQLFQRHAWQNDSLIANWEASIAIAYVSMLPGSPFYDMEAVRISYTQLAAWSIDSASASSQIILMRDAIDAFISLDRRLADLERDNELLEENLATRERALRRLRELTLGQQRGVAE